MHCSWKAKIGSNVFEPRTATGNEPFFYLTCLHTITFILLSILSLVQMISLKISERPLSWHEKCSLLGSSGGVVVRELASHLCGPGSIPGVDVIRGLSSLVLYSALRGLSPGTPVFPSPQKPTFDEI